jgi:N6-L-threonylcarbamoyladenine synthase
VICLGIESTAHTFGAAMVSERGDGEPESRQLEILSDVKNVYRAPEGSGIHPREASRHHIETAPIVLNEVVKDSGMTISEVDCIAYSAGPGLGPCLRVGAVVSRALASYFQKPLVPTNHAVGHIELGKELTGLVNPLVLLISGGHTALAAEVAGGWRIFGETLDLTLGQLLDQLGRFFGLASPAGPQIERLAAADSGKGNSILDLPYSVKGNDVSYSGLLSAAKDLYNSDKGTKEAISFAVQEYAFAMLVETTERALAFTERQELLVTGGVAANQRLSGMLREMCKKRGVSLGVIPMEYAGDCGAQIAVAGIRWFKSGVAVEPRRATTRQSWCLDRIHVD